MPLGNRNLVLYCSEEIPALSNVIFFSKMVALRARKQFTYAYVKTFASRCPYEELHYAVQGFDAASLVLVGALCAVKSRDYVLFCEHVKSWISSVTFDDVCIVHVIGMLLMMSRFDDLI